jgi:hypothetical protein
MSWLRYKDRLCLADSPSTMPSEEIGQSFTILPINAKNYPRTTVAQG